MRKNRINRRKFLGGSAAAAAAFTIVPSSVFGAKNRKIAPSDKLNIAGIGVGGKGSSDVNGAGGGNNVVALCDVDSARAGGTFKRYPNAKKYKDFRVMLDKEAKNIDAVTVSTPDHIHAVAALAAIQLGKHVYVQKPLCRTVYECRMLTEAAKHYKVATQMGNQGHAGEAIRACSEWIWDGAIGKVTEVHCWSDRPIWAQAMGRPAGQDPVPATLDWDLWLGPRPFRPYKNKVYAPFVWRGWWDFGTGAIGDMAVHNADPAFMALKLDAPVAAEAVSGPFTNESPPKWETITLYFGARGDMPPVKLIWYDGKKDGKHNRPAVPPELEKKRKIGGNGIMFGKKRGVKQVIPRAKGGHYGEWLNACKAGDPLGASGNFSYSGPFVESLLVGLVAVRAKTKIQWDAKNMKATNCPKADAWIRPTFRKGWDKGWDKIKI